MRYFIPCIGTDMPDRQSLDLLSELSAASCRNFLGSRLYQNEIYENRGRPIGASCWIYRLRKNHFDLEYYPPR